MITDVNHDHIGLRLLWLLSNMMYFYGPNGMNALQAVCAWRKQTSKFVVVSI